MDTTTCDNPAYTFVDCYNASNRGFRRTFMFYLKSNAIPKLSLKLMKIAKYFCFEEFPFTVISYFIFNEGYCQYRLVGSEEILDLNNLKEFPKKLWLTGYLQIGGEYSKSYLTLLLPKIAICEIDALTIYNQSITLKQLKTLVNEKLDYCRLMETSVTNSDDEILSVENILPHLPSIQVFDITFNNQTALTITPESTQNIIAALKESKINAVHLGNFPQTFDFDTFSKFIRESPLIEFDLAFWKTLPAEYVQKLQTFLDEIAQNGLENRKPVKFMF